MPANRIFERSLWREFSGTAAAIFIVLLSTVLVTNGVKLLGNAASGNVPVDAVAALIGFNMLAIMPWLLTLTTSMTVLWVLSRAWRDHEMAVWLSSGLALTAFLRPVLKFVVPMVLVSGLLSLGLTPWANQRAREYNDMMSRREEVNSVAPGVFKQPHNNELDQVYYVENFSGDAGAAKNVFIKSTKDGRQSVTVAREGYLTKESNGEHWAVLKDGRRYDGIIGHRDFRVVEFREARLRIDEGERLAASAQTKATDSLTLWRSKDPELKAELAWRLAIPVCTLLLAVLAIPMSHVNPRVGRAYNLLMAFPIFLIYNAVLNIGQTWIASGRWPVWLGLWPIHLCIVALCFYLFRSRMRPEK